MYYTAAVLNKTHFTKIKKKQKKDFIKWTVCNKNGDTIILPTKFNIGQQTSFFRPTIHFL